MGDDRSRTDDRILTDGHVRAHDHAAAQPRAMSNRDWLLRLPSQSPLRGVHRMRWREQLDPGTDLHLVINAHLPDIEDYRAIVDEGLAADRGLVAVIELHRRANHRVRTDPTEQLAEQLRPSAGLGGTGRVVLLD